ncbi:MAG: FAD-dependent oxidoreductase [Candidatus Eremiobacteraeota bacterium]|nr:FAD-dependent oxidoreductase [Candidatus Eremiobacteraeota bacterium]
MSNLRVAVVGAGPAGLYACEELLKTTDFEVHIDLYDALPTPYGLVRYGVAPDHQKIKNVTAVFEKIMRDPRLHFHGNVTVGQKELDWMRQAYHAVLFTVGAQTDRRLGVPGEDLPGSYSATDFVAWYNGHPDYKDHKFLLDQPRVAVVGVGNVAIDVARILLAGHDRLATTDIADHALEELKNCAVKEVHILARRGPLQAAFTNPELRELVEMEDVSFEIRSDELKLDPFSQAAHEAEPDKAVSKRLELLAQATQRPGADKRLVLRFLVSPLEIQGESRVEKLTLGRNQLTEKLSAKDTGERESLEIGTVFRSIGYKGQPLADLPFDEGKGVITNEGGRVVGQPGVYVAGWIKRGPSGVIGTNKPCAKESAQAILSDALAGRLQTPTHEIHEHLSGHQWVDFAGWKRLDDHEVNQGKDSGRPRIKVVERAAMLMHSSEEVATR